MDKDLHRGHRQRVRERYMSSVLDSFQDHQVLEFLLFYCFPMKDTNEIAHRMIKEFGSLSNLFEADPMEISRRCNVTQPVAVLVSMIPSLSNRYFKSKWNKKVVLDNTAVAGQFAIALFAGKTVECFYLICLDTQRRLIYADMIGRGTIDEMPIFPREVVQEALKFQSACVIFAHNHPSGSLRPSHSDIRVTEKLMTVFDCLKIDVLDHIIVGGDKFFSFASNRLLGLEY